MMPRLPQVEAAWILFLCLGAGATALGQHDPGRDAVRLLAQGDLEDARAELHRKSSTKKGAISDGERHFVLTLAACLENDAEEAIRQSQLALDHGIPVERFLAGPREVLQPLYRQEAFVALRGPSVSALIHGPMVGAVDASSARIWVRTLNEAEVRVECRSTPLSPAGDQKPARVASARTSAGTDYTTALALEKLEPDQAYRYDVWVDGQRQDRSGSFRTFPPPGRSGRFSVVFGGGAGLVPEHESMWTTILGRQPRALLLLGDNVYIDDPTHVWTQQYCYYRRQSRPEWRELVASTPVFTIYDDHDFGTDDCIPGREVDSPPWKRDVLHRFQQNWVNPAHGGGPAQPGCWFDFYIGDVHFVMLDGRYYRDLDAGSMLGDTQRAWLFDTLKASRGVFKVLASPVPWSAGIKPGSRDPWDGYPEERESIFSLIESEGISGVLLMAADRHRSDLRRTPRPNGYDLFEVMSSRLTNVHTHGLVENAKGSEFVMGYNERCSFGLLDFDTRSDNPSVTYRIVNIDGDEQGSKTLYLRDLR